MRCSFNTQVVYAIDRYMLGGGTNVILILCSFVVFTTGHFMFSFAFLLVLIFIQCDHLAWEERAGLEACRAFGYLFCVRYFFLGVRGWLRVVIVSLHRRFRF